MSDVDERDQEGSESGSVSSFEDRPDPDETEKELRALGLVMEDGRIKKKKPKFDAEGLHSKLEDFALPIEWPWVEVMSAATEHPVEVEDINDDYTRELAFYAQALECAQKAFVNMDNIGLKYWRPQDYFAEMVKSDEHMARIRLRLVQREQGIRKAEERRKAREQKRYGKQVHAERLQQRALEKRAQLEAVTRWRKSNKDRADGEAFDVSFMDNYEEEEERRASTAAGGNPKKRKAPPSQKSAKRRRKDEMFGAGGKKRNRKRNDAESAADVSGFNARANRKLPRSVKHKLIAKGKAGGGKKSKNRPGKGRRANQRARRGNAN